MDASISSSITEMAVVRAVGVLVMARILFSPISRRLTKSESVDGCTLLESNFEHQTIGALSWNVSPTFREYSRG